MITNTPATSHANKGLQEIWVACVAPFLSLDYSVTIKGKFGKQTNTRSLTVYGFSPTSPL